MRRVDGSHGATLLAGGYRNEVWRRRAGRDWVIDKRYVDRSDEVNPMYPNLPDAEARALALLGPRGLAPSLISSAPGQLTYRYVAGRMWRPGRIDAVTDVARLLYKVHSVTPPDGFRRLCRTPAEAVAHGDEMMAAVARGDAPHAVQVATARPTGATTRPPRRLSLVHSDCGPGNLVRSRHGLVLIDWQCPGIGDAVEDIACFLSPAMMVLYGCRPHSIRAREAFLGAYPEEEVVDRYRRTSDAWHYRIAAYCAWRADRLATSKPVVAARYRAAIDAELATGLVA